MNGNYTDGERLARVETLLVDKVIPKLDQMVTREQCSRNHPPQQPMIKVATQYLQVVALLAGLVAGGLAISGLEARIERVANTRPAPVAYPVPLPVPQPPRLDGSPGIPIVRR